MVRIDSAKGKRLRAPLTVQFGSPLTTAAALACLASPGWAQSNATAAISAPAASPTTASVDGSPALSSQAAPVAKPKPKSSSNGEDEDSQGIVVNGVHPPLPGAVVGDIPPELQYNQADIRAYGVSSVSDLLNELAPEIQSDRGRGGEAPVVLLNGRRISAFSEIQDIPTEAILRVDILPEEVALKYGYTADQKVVNIVLRRHFHSITSEGDGSTTTDGGAESGTGDLNLLRIHGDSRLNLDLKATDTAALKESQRDIISSTTGRPYDLVGNVTGVGGADLTGLEALTGQAVTVAGIPSAIAAGGTPTLRGFAGTANDPNVTDLTPYRTIGSAAKTIALNSVLAHPFGKKINATLNGTFNYSDTGSLRGLPSANLLVPSDDPFNPFGTNVEVARYLGTDALRQDIATLTGHLGTTVNADIAKWRLSFTAGYDYSDTRTHTDTGLDTTALQAALDAGDATLDPFTSLPTSLIGAKTRQTATAISNSGNAQFVANGPVFNVPAGPVSTSLKAGYTDSDFNTTSDRLDVVQRTSQSRSDASAQVNIDLPIASAKHHFLGFLGTLSANTNLAVDHYNDFGSETTIGFGLNWTPREGITFIASTTRDHAIPTVQQLAGPVVITPEVPVFDYLTGKTVDVSETTGGNLDLRADTRHVDKLGFNIKPIKTLDLTFTASYIRSSIRNAIAAFPSPTAAIESAFPGHFTRDSAGDLEAIDDRPINFADEKRQELRWGFNFTQKLKTSQALLDAYRALRQSGAFQRPNGGGPNGGGPGGDGLNVRPGPDGAGGANWGSGRGAGGGGGRGGAGGRLQISFYHTWYFRDDILVRPGVPTINLLDGGATGTGGGQPRHELTLQAGVTQNGIGMRMTGAWQSATTVDGTPGSTTGNLHFSSLGTMNFRLFADLGQIPSLVPHRWARGMRLTLSVTNILDTRQRVRDASGATPLAYQPDYLDPLGRAVKISLRKLFY